VSQLPVLLLDLVKPLLEGIGLGFEGPAINFINLVLAETLKQNLHKWGSKIDF
jgi:hypothetical protein